MIAGKYVDAIAAPLEDLAALFQAAGPCHLIARGDVIICLSREQAFERLPVVVDIGKDQQLQAIRVSPSPAVLSSKHLSEVLKESGSQMNTDERGLNHSFDRCSSRLICGLLRFH